MPDDTQVSLRDHIVSLLMVGCAGFFLFLIEGERSKDTALASMNRRLDGFNELREVVTTMVAANLTRPEADARDKATETRFTALETQVAANTGRGNGANSLWLILVAGVVMVCNVVTVIYLVTHGR